jgi:katanin p60 ATPase-containing subunit A1
MKTELLIQMDGVRGAKVSEQVFVMAASNLPWDLDIAVLRRFSTVFVYAILMYNVRNMLVDRNRIC